MHGAYIDMESLQAMYQWYYKMASVEVRNNTEVHSKPTKRGESTSIKKQRNRIVSLFIRQQ